MNARQMYEEFLELESSVNAFEITVDGVPVWERVRTDIYREIRIARNEWDGQIHQDRSGIKKYANSLRLLTQNALRRNPFTVAQRDILCYGYYTRQKEEDGLWWDIFSDPILDELEQFSYVYLESHDNGVHHTPAKTDTIRYTDMIHIIGKLKVVAGLVDYTLSASKKRELAKIEDEIEARFGVDIDVVSVSRAEIRKNRATKPLFRRLLSNINPLVAVILVQHGKETFIEVCNELGVATVELQHGVLTDYEYSYPGDRTKHTFPDYFLTWGEFWNDRVKFPIPQDRVRAVGYPYIETREEAYAHVARREQLVFISQPNVGKRLAHAALSLAREHSDEYDIVFKLHPKSFDQWRSRYPKLVDSEVEVVGENGRSLYRLFAESKAQIGVFSTALYEGLNFGLDTYLLDVPGARNLANLYYGSAAAVVEDDVKLYEAINNQSASSPVAGDYFKTDAVENIKMQLNEIYNRQVELSRQ